MKSTETVRNPQKPFRNRRKPSGILGNPRESSKTSSNPQKPFGILGIPQEPSETLRNPRKPQESSETVRNPLKNPRNSSGIETCFLALMVRARSPSGRYEFVSSNRKPDTQGYSLCSPLPFGFSTGLPTAEGISEVVEDEDADV